ncbi:hypothetical protein ACRAWD_31270 [Caulobacter segnis]
MAGDDDFLPGLLTGFGVQAQLHRHADRQVARATPRSNSREASDGVPGRQDPATLKRRAAALEEASCRRRAANLAAPYDLGKVSSALCAYNWRGRMICWTTYRRRTPGNIPAWVTTTDGQLDGSVFYTVNDRIKVGFQAVNLTNTKTKILVSYPGRPEEGLTGHNWVVADRRYSVVLRGTF